MRTRGPTRTTSKPRRHNPRLRARSDSSGHPGGGGVLSLGGLGTIGTCCGAWLPAVVCLAAASLVGDFTAACMMEVVIWCLQRNAEQVDMMWSCMEEVEMKAHDQINGGFQGIGQGPWANNFKTKFAKPYF